jgi:hypothetical protein
MSEFQRVRAEILDLLRRIVPENGLKYSNEELLKKHIDITVAAIVGEDAYE